MYTPKSGKLRIASPRTVTPLAWMVSPLQVDAQDTPFRMIWMLAVLVGPLSPLGADPGCV